MNCVPFKCNIILVLGSMKVLLFVIYRTCTASVYTYSDFTRVDIIAQCLDRLI